MIKAKSSTFKYVTLNRLHTKDSVHCFINLLNIGFCITGKLRCIDGVVVGDICYKMLYKVGSGVNFEEASSLCSFHGTTLAEIPTQQVYEAILNYMKKSWFYVIGQNVIAIRVWLGSSYSVSSLRQNIMQSLFLKKIKFVLH